MGCREFADVAEELALDVLTGRDRAAAVAHLDTCDPCREKLSQLMAAGESLLGLLPLREPPPGFETEVLERLGLVPPSPPRRPVGRVGRTRRMLTLAAASLAVVMSILGVRAASPARAPLGSAALLTASRQAVGRIFFYEGNSRWTYLSVHVGAGNDTVICQLETRDGHFITVGSFCLTDGYGSWGGADPANIGPLAGARLISTAGAVLATADILGAGEVIRHVRLDRVSVGHPRVAEPGHLG